MFRNILFALLSLTAGCDYCVDEASHMLGDGVVCTHGPGNVVLCLEKGGGTRGYICFVDGNSRGIALCLEGVSSTTKVEK